MTDVCKLPAAALRYLYIVNPRHVLFMSFMTLGLPASCHKYISITRAFRPRDRYGFKARSVTGL